MQVGDHDRVDVDVVERAAQLGEHAGAAVEQHAHAARPRPGSPSRRRRRPATRATFRATVISAVAHPTRRMLTAVGGVKDGVQVERGLLLSRRERPCGLAAALLAEHEAQLRRRAQPLGVIGPERRARLVELERAQAVAGEEALLARDLLRPLRASRRGDCG